MAKKAYLPIKVEFTSSKGEFGSGRFRSVLEAEAWISTAKSIGLITDGHTILDIEGANK